MILAPTLSILSSGSGAIVRPTFSRDFAGERTLNNGTGPAITFTRGSIGTYFDANGTLQTASNDVPRFDHDPATGASRGLLIEEARTNSIRNSQAGGSTNGVIGSSGVMPTNWLFGTASGITREVVATGTVNGMEYIDIRISGTNSSGSTVFPQLQIESQTQIVASSGQVWSLSSYVALVGGSLSGVDLRHNIQENQSDGTYVANNNTAFVPTASLARYAHTRTLTGALTARVAPSIIPFIAGSATIDLTLRIAAPQLEQGAFPTSYIPTTTAAVPRNADSAVVTPISSFYNQSEGTLFAEASRTHVAKAVSFLLMLKSDESPVASFVNLESGVASPATQRFQVGGGTGTALLNFADGVANTVYRMAGAYALNDFIGAQNGTLTSADTSGTAPATLDRMTIGMGATTAVPFYGGSQCHIRKIAYYPKRLSNALLEQLTT